jgi:hypothetical protein
VHLSACVYRQLHHRSDGQDLGYPQLHNPSARRHLWCVDLRVERVTSSLPISEILYAAEQRAISFKVDAAVVPTPLVFISVLSLYYLYTPRTITPNHKAAKKQRSNRAAGEREA